MRFPRHSRHRSWAALLAMQVVLAAAALAAPVVEMGAGSVSIVTPDFEGFVRAQMSSGHVPGMAMSIIDGNNTWSKVSRNVSLLPKVPDWASARATVTPQKITAL
jgi:hypothetical protein